MVATSCFKYMVITPFLFFFYFLFFHLMIDALNIKLCFATDVLTERSGSLSEPGSIFFHSDLNFLMQWSSFILLVRKGLFRVSAINRFYFSV